MAIFAMVACGGSNRPQAQAPTAASVSVQPGDVPKRMTRCELSGDINSVVAKEATPDPSTSRSFQKYWNDAQGLGAKSAYAAFYTNSSENCAAIKSSTAQIGGTKYPLLVNVVVEFKDEKSATNSYKNEVVFGLSASSLGGPGSPVIEGIKTGLTANSVVLTGSLSNQSYYIAMWQNKTFIVILFIFNVEAAASAKVATSENGRIK
jgi:hypothetical protein